MGKQKRVRRQPSRGSARPHRRRTAGRAHYDVGHPILQLQQMLGNRTTTALIQRADEGSMTVIGSASTEEIAAENASFTQELHQELAADAAPLSEDKVEAALAKMTTKQTFHSAHPGLGQLGIRPDEINGRKKAMYISNRNYYRDAKLPQARKDGEQMQATMEAVGYETIGHYKNKDAPGMEAAFNRAVKKVRAGDSLFMYYAGHGSEEGLVGIKARWVAQEAPAEEVGEAEAAAEPELEMEDLLPYSVPLDAMEEGVNKGVHSTFVADTCFSGTAADLVRSQAAARMAGQAGDARFEAVKHQIKRLEELKVNIPEEADYYALKKRGNDPITVALLNGAMYRVGDHHWQFTVKPELRKVDRYLQGAGLESVLPDKAGDNLKDSMIQVIDLFINKLIDLGETFFKEPSSVLATVPRFD